MNILKHGIFLIVYIQLSRCCNQLKGETVTCDEKKALLKYHNEMRAKVARGEVKLKNEQPAAEDMLEIYWSDDLQKQAQKWADRCVFAHSEKNDRPNQGENLGEQSSSSSKKGNLVEMAEEWYMEVEQYGYDGTFTKDNGHYSQLVWGSSYALGCGVSLYSKDNGYNTFMVCRYKPRGNMLNAKPYTYGNPDCAKHRLYKSIKYDGLCSRKSEAEQSSYDPCKGKATCLHCFQTSLLALCLLMIFAL